MSNAKILLGFVAGAAAGVLAGILFAPDEGKATRKKIAGKAGDLSESVKSSFGDFVDSLKQSYMSTREEVEDLGDEAKATAASVRADARSAMG